jgi:activator of 2-hydroxyglutaryl-CoA dehydratase
MEKHYLGIDVGSISSKAVILDENNNLLTSSYLWTEGNPINAIKKVLADLQKQLKTKNTNIVSVGVTGSARELIGSMLDAQIIKNEITAHAVGTLAFHPDVKTIFEIGGQDSKIIILQDGVVTDYQMNTLCVLENTEIITDNFLPKFIKDLKKGENVLTHKGKFKKISKTFKRKYNGKILKIKVGGKILELTPEHPILVLKRKYIKCYQEKKRNKNIYICKPETIGSCKKRCSKKYRFSFVPEFIKAEDLEKGDFLLTPLSKKIINKKTINNFIQETNEEIDFSKNSKVDIEKFKKIVEKWKNGERIYKIAKDLNLSYPTVRKYINKKIKKNPYEKRPRFVINNININKDFLRVLGYYLSEGNIMHNYSRRNKKIKYLSGVQFTFNINEEEYVQTITYYLIKNFPKINFNIRKIKHRNTLILEVFNKDLAILIKKLCGTGAKEKLICKDLMFLEPKLQKEIAKGFFEGDGHFEKRTSGKSSNRFVATTISKNLANQLYWIILRDNIKVKLIKHHAKTKGGNFRYDIAVYGDDVDKLMDKDLSNIKKKSTFKSFIFKDFMYEPVDEIIEKNFKGFVYNLEVEDDNSYVASLLSVHNCAAGTGAFLTSQARRLNLPIEDFGKHALKSKNPSKIAGRCTVFAESDLVHKAQIGHKKQDLVAGLCNAIVNNYLNNVGKGKKIQEPIVFQGGVSKNPGVVKAFENTTNKKILVDDNGHLMGAIGSAILAKESNKEKPFNFNIKNTDFKTRGFECGNCPNDCEIVCMLKNNKFIDCWGNRCETGPERAREKFG